jgi:hypothetical protein
MAPDHLGMTQAKQLAHPPNGKAHAFPLSILTSSSSAHEPDSFPHTSSNFEIDSSFTNSLPISNTVNTRHAATGSAPPATTPANQAAEPLSIAVTVIEIDCTRDMPSIAAEAYRGRTSISIHRRFLLLILPLHSRNQSIAIG